MDARRDVGDAGGTAQGARSENEGRLEVASGDDAHERSELSKRRRREAGEARVRKERRKHRGFIRLRRERHETEASEDGRTRETNDQSLHRIEHTVGR